MLQVDDLTIKMTNSCNLNCPYCFANANNEEETSVLSIEEIKEAIEIIKPSRIAFSGGEPLLRYDDIVSLLPYCAKKVDYLARGIRIETNGTIPTNFDDFEINGNRNVVCFNTTLDGFKDLNDSRRGEGTFEKVSKFAMNAVDAGYWTMIKGVFDDDLLLEDEDYLYEFGKYCYQSLGIRRMRMGHAKSSGRATRKISPNYKNYILNMNTNVVNISRRIENEFNYISPDQWNYFIMPEFCLTCVYERNDLYLDTNGIVSVGCAFVNVPICHYSKYTPELHEKAKFLMKRKGIGAKNGIVKTADRLF